MGLGLLLEISIFQLELSSENLLRHKSEAKTAEKKVVDSNLPHASVGLPVPKTEEKKGKQILNRFLSVAVMMMIVIFVTDRIFPLFF